MAARSGCSFAKSFGTWIRIIGAIGWLAPRSALLVLDEGSADPRHAHAHAHASTRACARRAAVWGPGMGRLHFACHRFRRLQWRWVRLAHHTGMKGGGRWTWYSMVVATRLWWPDSSEGRAHDDLLRSAGGRAVAWSAVYHTSVWFVSGRRNGQEQAGGRICSMLASDEVIGCGCVRCPLSRAECRTRGGTGLQATFYSCSLYWPVKL